MRAPLSSWLHADDEPAAAAEAASPGTAASPEPRVHDESAAMTAFPESTASVSASPAAPPPPIDALLGRSMGGLGGQKLCFRPQLFWQEVRSRCLGLQPRHMGLPPEPTAECIRRCCPSTRRPAASSSTWTGAAAATSRACPATPRCRAMAATPAPWRAPCRTARVVVPRRRRVSWAERCGRR